MGECAAAGVRARCAEFIKIISSHMLSAEGPGWRDASLVSLPPSAPPQPPSCPCTLPASRRLFISHPGWTVALVPLMGEVWGGEPQGFLRKTMWVECVSV
jgi:hypothetical protein